MQEYVIMTDSSCDLPADKIRALELDVIPMTFQVSGKEYANYPDEREIGFHEFYEMMRAGAPGTTSSVNVSAWVESMRANLLHGKSILALAFSSALSGTYNAARLAAEELRPAFPNQQILVVDTLCASLGQGLLVTLTAQQKQQGATLEQARDYAENNKLHLCHWFTVDDLYFLKRGGRVSASVALVGTMLDIKPVMHVDDLGRLTKVTVAKGRRASLRMLVDQMEKSAIEPEKQMVYISHGDCLDDAQYVADLVRERFGCKTILINFVGPVIGTHSGPGTIALFFLGAKR
jgi:DegV family protein with EDD domain